MEQDKMHIIDFIVINISNIFSFLALAIAYLSYRNSTKNTKQTFKNLLRENIKKAKHKILELEYKEFNHIEKTRIIESFQDLLFYQGYKIEKKKYLDRQQNRELSKIQEDIEDYASCIFSNYDIEVNKDHAKESLNRKLYETNNNKNLFEGVANKFNLKDLEFIQDLNTNNRMIFSVFLLWHIITKIKFLKIFRSNFIAVYRK